jgi:BirA family transcriptional regulator, biotin operon repressor / biotin---[acetyl-CoA-carboxylase] ligase
VSATEPGANRLPGPSDAPALARLGAPRVHLRRTDSTNERARALARAGAPHGTLVTAAEQTAGRGRQGRRWSAPPGHSLLMSLIVRSPPRLLPLIAPLAVCDAVDVVSPPGDRPRALVKWPNDVVLYPPGTEAESDAPLAKLAGILIEARLQEDWAVLGIGVNVAVRLEDLPEELRPDRSPGVEPPASGLPAATLGLPPSEVEPTLTALLAALARRMQDDEALTLDAWRSRDALHGREIAWAEGRGRAQGIDGDGRLVVTLADGGRTALGAGEVHLRELG